MEINYAKIAGRPFAEPFARVYLFDGAEEAQKQEALARLQAQLIDDASSSFDLETHEGKELTSDTLFASATSLPFMSKKRMIIVRRANMIAAPEQERIAVRLPRVPDTTVVVFVGAARSGKRGKGKARSVSSKLEKAINEVGAIITFAALRSEEAVHEIGRKMSEQGKKVEGAVLRRLVERVGGDLTILESEAQKVIDYVGERDFVTVQDVDFVTGQKPEERIWKLVDAVGSRNPAAALRLLKETLESAGGSDGEASRVLSLILRQLRLIWQAKTVELHKERLPQVGEAVLEALPLDNNVAAICQRQPFQARRLQEQARNFSLDELDRCFEYAAAADLAMKGVEGDVEDPAVALELLVINLCRRRKT